MHDTIAAPRLHELPTPHGVLRYRDVGDGPPLLLLHGSGPGVTGWQNFRQNLPALSERHRCLVLEFPGFGVSDPSEGHPMVTAPLAVRALVDGLGLGRVDVIGNSMGGVVALQLAIRKPDLFRRIVTVGGVGKNLLSPFPAEGMNLLMDFTDDPDRSSLVRWLHTMVSDRSLITDDLVAERWARATEPSTLASARRMYGRAAMTAALAAAEASPEPPYWAQLHRITAPVLLTWGRDDRVSPLDMALLPLRTIPRAELHVFPDCGHWTMIEQQRAWESAVLAFLDRADEG